MRKYFSYTLKLKPQILPIACKHACLYDSQTQNLQEKFYNAVLPENHIGINMIKALSAYQESLKKSLEIISPKVFF